MAANITKIYSDDQHGVFKALDDVSFEVSEPEILGISGPSGSGKTTLLSIIGLLEPPTSGTLKLLGKNTGTLDDSKLSEMRLHEIGMIFQEHNLLPALTVYENIELPLRLEKLPKNHRDDRIHELLEIVSLGDLGDRYPSQLSRGQRQRVAAVRAFANNPRIVLADEPTSDLDKENASILLDYLKFLYEEKGTTIIFAATDRDAFKPISTRRLRLVEGRLVEGA
jgi:putative ABC transport system ATP-binding protein